MARHPKAKERGNRGPAAATSHHQNILQQIVCLGLPHLGYPRGGTLIYHNSVITRFRLFLAALTSSRLSLPIGGVSSHCYVGISQAYANASTVWGHQHRWRRPATLRSHHCLFLSRSSLLSRTSSMTLPCNSTRTHTYIHVNCNGQLHNTRSLTHMTRISIRR